ncbi:Hypothetical_protein [Hexamita inflata]|uniref:Hypothetical_protein n=1 Tax=Hexamita inflata TaxID=28002 RepID=A0AA86QEY7_9EUKA|nr:Hypothetical protein HINF_LOCUS41423 [Hexamita inflata]
MKSRTTPKVPSRLSQIKTISAPSSTASYFRSYKSVPCTTLQMTMDYSETESDDEFDVNSFSFLTQLIRSSIQSTSQQVQRICKVERHLYTQMQNIQILFQNQRNVIHYFVDDILLIK